MVESVAICATDGFGWVEPWIIARFGDGLTALKYRYSWSKLKAYFAESGIKEANGITRAAIYQYLVWRKDVARNTAYAELRVLSVILHEAVLRSYINANPATRLGIKRLPPKKLKPEYSADTLDAIARAADSETGKHAQFYRVAFAIARYHGCRIAETRLPMSAINFEDNEITFATKGGKELTVPIHAKIRAMLLDLKEKGCAYTFAEPSNPGYMSTYFQKFLKRHGFRDLIPNSCFHCLRVSVASQLARNGVPENKTLRYMGHASTTVHRQYIRHSHRDLVDVGAKLH